MPKTPPKHHRLDPADAAASASFLQWDVSAFPHVIGRTQAAKPTAESIAAMLRCFDHLLTGPHRFTLMFDLRDGTMAPLSFLKQLAEFLRTRRALIVAKLECSTIVCGVGTKALLDLFFTFFTPARPNRRFRSEAEAVTWTLERWPTDPPPAGTESAQP